jgi:hypothetical protein
MFKIPCHLLVLNLISVSFQMRKKRIKPIDQAMTSVQLNSHDRFEDDLELKFISSYKGKINFDEVLLSLMG